MTMTTIIIALALFSAAALADEKTPVAPDSLVSVTEVRFRETVPLLKLKTLSEMLRQEEQTSVYTEAAKNGRANIVQVKWK